MQGTSVSRTPIFERPDYKMLATTKCSEMQTIMNMVVVESQAVSNDVLPGDVGAAAVLE